PLRLFLLLYRKFYTIDSGVRDMKEQANFRIDAAAKAKAYAVFEKMGIRPTDAVNMFINHVAMFGELPFRPRVPNAETLSALKEGEEGQLTSYTLDEFRNSLGLKK